MPRTYRKRKEREAFFIKEVLGVLGYRISSPKWTESPDAILTLTKGRMRKRVAIEHTEYFNDTVAGKPSPRTTLDTFWNAVHSSLVRRVSHIPSLSAVTVDIRLNTRVLNPKDDIASARQLAKEIVDFVRTCALRKSERRRFRSHDFREFGVLGRLVASLSVFGGKDDVVFSPHSDWTCADVTTGGVVVDLEYIKSAIRAKNQKADKYNWRGAAEKWLLIAASAHNPSNDAGPLKPSVDLRDDELSRLCGSSPFDKILFWERRLDWYKWLKPEKQARQYRNPYIN